MGVKQRTDQWLIAMAAATCSFLAGNGSWAWSEPSQQRLLVEPAGMPVNRSTPRPWRIDPFSQSAQQAWTFQRLHTAARPSPSWPQVIVPVQGRVVLSEPGSAPGSGSAVNDASSTRRSQSAADVRHRATPLQGRADSSLQLHLPETRPSVDDAEHRRVTSRRADNSRDAQPQPTRRRQSGNETRAENRDRADEQTARARRSEHATQNPPAILSLDSEVSSLPGRAEYRKDQSDDDRRQRAAGARPRRGLLRRVFSRDEESDARETMRADDEDKRVVRPDRKHSSRSARRDDQSRVAMDPVPESSTDELNDSRRRQSAPTGRSATNEGESQTSRGFWATLKRKFGR
jgi:hypothetical protein